MNSLNERRVTLILLDSLFMKYMYDFSKREQTRVFIFTEIYHTAKVLLSLSKIPKLPTSKKPNPGTEKMER